MASSMLYLLLLSIFYKDCTAQFGWFPTMAPISIPTMGPFSVAPCLTALQANLSLPVGTCRCTLSSSDKTLIQDKLTTALTNLAACHRKQFITFASYADGGVPQPAALAQSMTSGADISANPPFWVIDYVSKFSDPLKTSAGILLTYYGASIKGVHTSQTLNYPGLDASNNLCPCSAVYAAYFNYTSLPAPFNTNLLTNTSNTYATTSWSIEDSISTLYAATPVSRSFAQAQVQRYFNNAIPPYAAVVLLFNDISAVNQTVNYYTAAVNNTSLSSSFQQYPPLHFPAVDKDAGLSCLRHLVQRERCFSAISPQAITTMAPTSTPTTWSPTTASTTMSPSTPTTTTSSSSTPTATTALPGAGTMTSPGYMQSTVNGVATTSFPASGQSSTGNTNPTFFASGMPSVSVPGVSNGATASPSIASSSASAAVSGSPTQSPSSSTTASVGSGATTVQGSASSTSYLLTTLAALSSSNARTSSTGTVNGLTTPRSTAASGVTMTATSRRSTTARNRTGTTVPMALNSSSPATSSNPNFNTSSTTSTFNGSTTNPLINTTGDVTTTTAASDHQDLGLLTPPPFTVQMTSVTIPAVVGVMLVIGCCLGSISLLHHFGSSNAKSLLS